MNTRALNRATLARQLLLERSSMKPAQAIAQIAGMQAQVPKPPFIGLWTRLAKFERDDLRKLFAKGEVLRGTLMRGTLHIATKKDFAAWRATLQPVLTQGAQSVTRGAVEIETVVAEAQKFLAKGPRVFEDIRQHLVAKFPGVNDRLLGYVVRMHLPLAMTPDDSAWSFPPDSQFALTAIGKPDLHAFALRYLAAFGPATAADFQTWSGLRGVSKLFAELDVERLRDDKGRELFDVPGAPRPDEDTPAPVRFLPEFDNLLLAHADRTRIVSEEFRPRIVTKNLRVLATFLVDGFVAGTWTIAKKTLVVTPFAKLTRAQKIAVDEEGERLMQFARD
ncbi:MAG TPA: winged helix DNA-binding domain-containing protein [Thermoanaerobaculia bacterium]|nr:winged helix DNA-binding domain-containing protein [Thermoanaerobaculia bacterium]